MSGRPVPARILTTAAERRPEPVLQRADALRRDGQPARRDRARPELGADVRLGRRAARARSAAALAGDVRPGHRRRHRLDRDAAHLLLEPAGARPSGHERRPCPDTSWTSSTTSAARSRPARSATSTSAAPAPSHYHHQRDKTRAALHGAAFFTGDRYRRLEDGCFVYEGRADDMIKVGGLWASPIEIENVLVEHPKVLEAAVIGVDADYTTRIKAYIVCREGTGADELVSDLQTWCKDRLRRYEFPHFIEFPGRAAQDADRQDPALQAARDGMRDVDHLIVGGGPAGFGLRALAARGRRRRRDPARRARARPAVQPPGCSKGYLRGEERARSRCFRARRVVGRADDRAADAHERRRSSTRGADGEALEQGGGRASASAPARHRRERAPAERRRLRARADPLPAHARQRRRDPRGRRGRGARSC